MFVIEIAYLFLDPIKINILMFYVLSMDKQIKSAVLRDCVVKNNLNY